jgi:hypothetical protein
MFVESVWGYMGDKPAKRVSVRVDIVICASMWRRVIACEAVQRMGDSGRTRFLVFICALLVT